MGELLDLINIDDSFVEDKSVNKSKLITNVESQMIYGTTDRDEIKKQLQFKIDNGEELNDRERHLLADDSTDPADLLHGDPRLNRKRKGGYAIEKLLDLEQYDLNSGIN